MGRDVPRLESCGSTFFWTRTRKKIKFWTRTRKKNKILDQGPIRTRSGPDPNILFNYTIKKNQEILKNKKESINIDFNSSMFRFKAECKSDLRLNLDIDPTRK